MLPGIQRRFWLNQDDVDFLVSDRHVDAARTDDNSPSLMTASWLRNSSAACLSRPETVRLRFHDDAR